MVRIVVKSLLAQGCAMARILEPYNSTKAHVIGITRAFVYTIMDWRRRRYFAGVNAVVAWSNHGLLLRNSMVHEPEGIKKLPR